MPQAKEPLIVIGMHGLGDGLYSRAVIRCILRTQPQYDLWLKTPWPCLYHDLRNRLHLVDIRSVLRTQTKNSIREREHFTDDDVPAGAASIEPRYTVAAQKHFGAVIPAMMARVGLQPNPADFDFRLPIPQAWHDKIKPLLDEWRPDKPILIVRPLVERTEWAGFCTVRNPDFLAYAQLLEAVRAGYFVVSVADLSPDREWEVGLEYAADVKLHNGELDTEALVALFAAADLVFTSSGFAVPLAQAVSTPVICVFGGYETSKSFSLSPTPYIGIDPINPCNCFTNHHDCNKQIDMKQALRDMRDFKEIINGFQSIIPSRTSGAATAQGG